MLGIVGREGVIEVSVGNDGEATAASFNEDEHVPRDDSRTIVTV